MSCKGLGKMLNRLLTRLLDGKPRDDVRSSSRGLTYLRQWMRTSLPQRYNTLAADERG